RAMLQDALATFERQIESAELGVALFELVDHTQRLQVVLEATVGAQTFVQRVLAGVAERRVAEIVREADGLCQLLVQAQRASGRARDLRDLDRMGDARAVEVALVI